MPAGKTTHAGRDELSQLLSDVEYVLEFPHPWMDVFGAAQVAFVAGRDLTHSEQTQVHRALREASPQLAEITADLRREQQEEPLDAEMTEVLACAQRSVETISQLHTPEPPAARTVSPPAPGRTPADAPQSATSSADEDAADTPPGKASRFDEETLAALHAIPTGVTAAAVAGPRPERLVFVHLSDWEGVYLDGQLIAEGHTVTARDLAEALGMTAETEDPPHDDVTFVIGLPSQLEDVRRLQARPAN